MDRIRELIAGNINERQNYKLYLRYNVQIKNINKLRILLTIFRMNPSIFILIISIMLPGLIVRSHILLDPIEREDSDDDAEEHAGDMILTKEQLDKIKKETETSNRSDRNDETIIDDMIFTPEQMAIINGEIDPEDRGIAPDWADHWDFKDDNQPGMVIVPFKLDSGFSYDEKEWIRKALKEIEAVSCIRQLRIYRNMINSVDLIKDLKKNW